MNRIRPQQLSVKTPILLRLSARVVFRPRSFKSYCLDHQYYSCAVRPSWPGSAFFICVFHAPVPSSPWLFFHALFQDGS
nr:MAG TPA: hypothetical protein [Caudoviricetes sp.]